MFCAFLFFFCVAPFYFHRLCVGRASGSLRVGAMFQMIQETAQRICFTTGGICPHREDVVPLCVTEGFCGGKRGPKTGIERRVPSPARVRRAAPRRPCPTAPPPAARPRAPQLAAACAAGGVRAIARSP